MTDNMPRNHSTSRHPDDWRAFADLVLETLTDPAYRNWTCLAQPRADGPGASGASGRDRKMGEQSPAKTEPVAPDTDADPHDVNALLDWIEREEMGECLPPCPSSYARRTSYRPLVSVMMSVLQLARTFRTPEGFRTAVAAPGAVGFLSGVAPGQDDLMARLLDAMVWRDEVCPGKPDVHVTLPDDAATVGRHPTKTLFPAFSEAFGKALEHGQAILILGGSHAALPTALGSIVTTEIALAPFDIDMVLAILARVYPGSGVTADDILARIPAEDIARLSAQALTLATRAQTPHEALSRLAGAARSPVDEAPGLSHFPIAEDIRAPIDRMLADITDWHAGEIPWDDVSRGILLAGPPGCGKTEIPRLLAREAGVEVRATSLSKWQSGGARSSDLLRQMRTFFDEAATAGPCIVFIDELDAIGDRDRPHDQNSSWTESIVAGLLECLDGFDDAPGVVVMGATNHPQKIDAALRRPGRFDRTLTMHQPTPDLLPRAFRWHLRDDLAGADLDALIGIATGMTGADIAASVRDARGRARQGRRPLSLDDLRVAITDRRPPLDPALRWQVAVHETGHAILATSTGRARPYLLSLHAAGGDTGMTSAPSGLYLDEMKADLACLLAGRAAERGVLGRPSGGAGGAEDSDLAVATRLATAIELSYGLGASGTAWLGPPAAVVERLRFDRDLQRRVTAHLAGAEQHAMAVLEENRDLLREMARDLAQRGALSGERLSHFMQRVTAVRDTEPETRKECDAGTPIDT